MAGPADDETRYYTAALQLLNNAEDATWKRLQALLVASAFLIAAWVTATKEKPELAIVPAMAGTIMSFFFWFVLARSRRWVTFYLDFAKGLEKDRQGPLSVGAEAEKAFPFHAKVVGSRYVAPGVGCVLCIVFALLAWHPW